MWTLERPDVDEVDAQLDKALTYVNGHVVYALSDAERAAIHGLYDDYEQLEGHADDALTPAALDACGQAIKDGYGQVQKGGRLEHLRGILINAARECPLCGFAEATTLDHHLGKAEFPNLAIYPRNLVPACQPCNRLKGVVGGFGHPYYQQHPDSDFLVADVAYDAGSLVVEFSIDPAGLDEELVDALELQIGQLELNRRFVSQINTFLFGQKAAFETLLELPHHDQLVRSYLLRSATTLARDFGRNHWRAALIRGLAANDPFCADPMSYLEKPLAEVG